MASMQRYDGPSLEAVLADVQAKHGDSARILNAHRVRAGGVGGFFARERFEVEVEVDAGEEAGDGRKDGAGEGAPDGVRVPTSILDLADDVSAREAGPAPSSFASVLAARMATEHARSTMEAAGDPVGAATAASGVVMSHDPTAATSSSMRQEGADSAPSCRTARQAVPSPGPAAATATVPEVAVSPEVAMTLPSTVAAPGRPTVVTVPAPAVPAPAVPAPVVPAPVVPAPAVPAPAVPAPVVPAPAVPVLVPVPPSALPAAAPPVLSPVPAPAAPDVHRRPELAPLFDVDPFVARLTRRGLPVPLVPRGPVPDVRTALVAVLSGLPAVPEVPSGRGAVVATVGEREEAYALARRIGAERGVEAEHVVLASPTYRGRRVPAWARLAGIDEAASERRSWRRRAGVTVVAVESPVDGDQAEWAAAVLDALEPNLTWGIVSAGRKTEDVAWWIERIGGVDALAVEGARRTVTPGAVLSLGVPVGLVDGEAATAAGWADLLLAGAAT